MFRQPLRRALLAPVLFVSLSCGALAGEQASRWAGLVEQGERASFLHLRLLEDAGTARAEMRRPGAMGNEGWQALKLRRLGANAWEFELPAGLGGARCQATRRGDQLASRPGADCRLSLKQITDTDAAPAPLPPGLYRLSDGRAISIGWLADFPQPTLLELKSGRWAYLFSQRAGEASTGTTLQRPLPVHLRLRALPDGRLRWQEAGGRTLTAERVPVRERKLEWWNGEQKLAGTLMLPPGAGPFAAVVLSPMSTDAPRDAYRQQAEYFISQGLAALIYDKRGTGESVSGDRRGTGMPDLAQDAIAGLELLQRQPELDAKRLGIWGHSQGGWVAPLAAARSEAVRFVIAQSGPSVTAAEQEIYRVETSARNEGLSPAEVAEAGDYERRLMHWVKTGGGREWLEQAARGPQSKSRWAHLVEFHEKLPELPSSRAQSFWYFDPMPDYARVRVPMLAVFGDRDAFVPVAKSAQLLEQALQQAGNRDYEIRVLPRAAHGLWETELENGQHAARTRGFHPEYFPTLTRWLQRQGLSTERP